MDAGTGKSTGQQQQLDKQIDAGAERVLTAPDSLLDLLTTKLESWRRERDQVAAALRTAEQAAKPIDIAAEADRLARKAWGLLDALAQAEPARLRELLRTAVERIELTFAAEAQGKRQLYTCTGGRVVFRELSGFVNRGEPRKSCPTIDFAAMELQAVA